jgi:hypothetical protein
MGENEYITVAEARDILGVSDPKIARMIRDGQLTAEENPVDRKGLEPASCAAGVSP